MRRNHQNVLDSTVAAPMETHFRGATRAVGTPHETLRALEERMWNEITWNVITWNELLLKC